MAELEDLVRDASRYYPSLRDVPRRWLLVDAADHVLTDLRGRLGEYAASQLERRGFELRLATGLTSVDARGVELSDGERRPRRPRSSGRRACARTRSSPSSAFRSTTAAGCRSTSTCASRGRRDVWALGDVAPPCPTPPRPRRADPPTCQHALRQARTLARNIAADARGRPLKAYRYRMLGQAATLGRHKGVCRGAGQIRFRGFPGWWLTRTYHLYQLPLMSRRLRVVSDWTVGLFFRRDVVELGSLGRPEPLEPPPP